MHFSFANPFCFSGSKPRQRRRRTAFSDDQLDRLEETFHDEKFPGITTRDQLASELGIGEDRIQVALCFLLIAWIM